MPSQEEEEEEKEACFREWETEWEALQAIFMGEEDALQVVRDGNDGDEEQEEEEGGAEERKKQVFREKVEEEQDTFLPRKVVIKCEVSLEGGRTLDFIIPAARSSTIRSTDDDRQQGGRGEGDDGAAQGGGGGGADTGGGGDDGDGPCVRGIRFLPPVYLHVTIPLLYPIHEAPHLEVSCLWLDRERRERAKALMLGMFDNMYRGGGGVMYAWVEWCRSGEMMEAVGVGSKVMVVALEEEAEGEGEGRLLSLFQHNYCKESEAFQQAMVTCLICMEEKKGRAFTPLHCGHCCWCTECLTGMAKVNIAEGSVLNIKCPAPDCGEALTPDVVKALVSDDEFARWERLLLQKTLDRMEDLVYCPRCEAPTLEDKGHLGQCVKCFFAFCSLCRDSYHPGLECMSPEEKLRALELRVQRTPNTQVGTDRMAQIRRMAEDNLSLQEVRRTAKKCPGCGMGISKTEGCSKVRCASCGVYFCWLCNKDITEEGYDHFRTGGTCELFEAEEVARWNRAMNRNIHQEIGRIVRQRGQQDEVRIVRCGSCNAQNVVLDQNNHLLCWACRNHFCALCRSIVRKHSLHFGAGKCKQHGR